MLDADLKTQLKGYLERLTQPVEILVGVDAVVPGAPPGPRQQADGFVIQHRAACQIAAPRQACDRK